MVLDVTSKMSERGAERTECCRTFTVNSRASLHSGAQGMRPCVPAASSTEAPQSRSAYLRNAVHKVGQCGHAAGLQLHQAGGEGPGSGEAGTVLCNRAEGLSKGGSHHTAGSLFTHPIRGGPPHAKPPAASRQQWAACWAAQCVPLTDGQPLKADFAACGWHAQASTTRHQHDQGLSPLTRRAHPRS